MNGKLKEREIAHHKPPDGLPTHNNVGRKRSGHSLHEKRQDLPH